MRKRCNVYRERILHECISPIRELIAWERYQGNVIKVKLSTEENKRTQTKEIGKQITEQR